MIKPLLVFNTIFILTMFNVLSVHSMENLDNDDKQEQEHTQSADQDQVQLIEERIKSFMRLRSVCKEYNALLTCEMVGDLCQHYAQCDKDTVLKNLIEFKTEILENVSHDAKTTEEYIKNHYAAIRLPALILICAGADPATKFGHGNLLGTAAHFNDVHMVKKLFEHKADPNMKMFDYPYCSDPILFVITTKEMAQLFIDNGVNLHVSRYGYPSVLWWVLKDELPAELMALYLEKGVAQTKSGKDNKSFSGSFSNKSNILFLYFARRRLS